MDNRSKLKKHPLIAALKQATLAYCRESREFKSGDGLKVAADYYEQVIKKSDLKSKEDIDNLVNKILADISGKSDLKNSVDYRKHLLVALYSFFSDQPISAGNEFWEKIESDAEDKKQALSIMHDFTKEKYVSREKLFDAEEIVVTDKKDALLKCLVYTISLQQISKYLTNEKGKFLNLFSSEGIARAEKLQAKLQAKIDKYQSCLEGDFEDSSVDFFENKKAWNWLLDLLNDRGIGFGLRSSTHLKYDLALGLVTILTQPSTHLSQIKGFIEDPLGSDLFSVLSIEKKFFPQSNQAAYDVRCSTAMRYLNILAEHGVISPEKASIDGEGDICLSRLGK